MTRQEMVFLLRQHLSDETATGWPNESELIAFLDRAADYMSEKLIADRDPTMTRRIEIDGLTDMPDDFVSFVGLVPVRVMGRVCESYEYNPMTAQYWARLPYPSAFDEDDELPVTREHALLIIAYAVICAQNKNEFDISQDMALLSEINKAISKTRGGER